MRTGKTTFMTSVESLKVILVVVNKLPKASLKSHNKISICTRRQLAFLSRRIVNLVANLFAFTVVSLACFY